MTARLRAIAFDCPDARRLASFYSVIMGLPTRFVDTVERVEIGHDHGRTRLAFVTVPDHRRPTWPDPAYPQQVHLDIPAFDADRVRGPDDGTEPAWFSRRWHERVLDLGSPGWVIIRGADGQPPGLSFAGASGKPPRWRDPERPPQAHLEIAATDPRATEELALRLGATRLERHPSGDLLLADPEGHPLRLHLGP